jgi:calcineurin-like phosphoesterase family protein
LQIIEKTENSFQEYDLLFYEINSIKQTLISQCKKINQRVLSNILKIKNPNDSIYFLMKIFFWRIKDFEEGQNKKNVEWEYIRKNLTYKSIISYL